MKRLLFALSVLLLPGVAFAFDPSPATVRIGILRAPDTFRYEAAEHVHRAIRESLSAELRSRGFDAYEVEANFDQVSRDADRNADFYVEIAGDSETSDRGGLGVGGRHASLTMGKLVSTVAADFFVYDGRTMEMIANDTLTGRDSAFVPTSVGIGGSNLFAWIAMPFIERAQVRGVARDVARELAGRVTVAVRSH